MRKPETLEIVRERERESRNLNNIINKLQKNNLRNKVVLISVSEKAVRVEREKRIESIMEDSKDSVLHYGIKQAEMFVLV